MILSSNKFEYFKDISKIVSVRTEEGEGVLAKEYEKINIIPQDTALYKYFNLYDRTVDNLNRKIFTLKELYSHSEVFNKEYPIVFSTTYSIKNSLNNNYKYDYLQHSFLESIKLTLKNAPKTLLKEHYRCHPKIIQLCNKKFYDNQLIIMTEDKGEEDVLKVYVTNEGNHARGQLNQRQIDVIKNEVLPELSEKINIKNIGIISPYRKQKAQMEKTIEEELKFAINTWTHIDFIVFNKMDKKLVLAIEVDGYYFHKEGTKQQQRDKIKDKILYKYDIPLIRLNTTESGEKEKLEEKIKEVFKK